MKSSDDKYLRLFPSAALACLLALGGCATSAPLVTMAPVGPKPPEVHPAGQLEGYLKVYSITREYNSGDLIYYPHRRYFIYNMDGKRLRTVDNRVSRKDEEPQLVSLPVGKYYVVGESDNDGLLRVPVIIKGGEKTVVNLEGARASDTDSQVDPSRAVKTPGGRVVGWPAS